MKKTILLSAITASLVMAGGDISPMEPVVTPNNTMGATPINNISLTDYKVITGTYSDAYINGSLSASNAFESDDPASTREEASFDAHVDANFRNIYNTAAYSWTVGGLANANWSKGSAKDADTISSYDVSAYTTFDKYFFNDDTWFGYGSADAGYRKAAGVDDADDPYFKVGAGVGYGRMYDATPLAKALRIVEDLVEYGLVDAGMSVDAKLALAKVIDNEDVYASKYGSLEYKKYWYQAMEKVLKEHGVLTKGDLGAFGAVRISEILDIQRVAPRFHGWKVRGGFGKVLSNYDGVSEDTTVDASFEYGLPIGLTSQFYNVATVSAILDSKSDLEYQFVNNANYTYEIADRVDWENSYTFKYDAFDKADNFKSHSLSTGFRYYLANRLQLTASVSAVKTDAYKDWDAQLYTGITYRLK